MMKVSGGFLERICKKVKRKRDHRNRGGQVWSKKLADLEGQGSVEHSLVVEQGQLEATITPSNPGPSQLQQSERLREEKLRSNGSYSRDAFLDPCTADVSKTTTRRCSLPTVRMLQLSSTPSPVRSCTPSPVRSCTPSTLLLSINSTTKERSSKIIDNLGQECTCSPHTPTTPALKDLYMLSATDSGLYSEEEGSASEEEYLDVFSDEDGVGKEDEEDGTIVGDGWVISAREVSLDKMVVSNSCETIYSGYWHGNVAVHARYSNTNESYRSILADVGTLTNIRHENIQLFLGVCHDLHSDYISIVMDQMKGLSLHTLIHKQGHKFNFQSLTKIMSQVSQGLAYLHAKCIPHPLLTSQSVTLHYRICISMLTPSSASMGIVNTSDLPYLPPEVMRTVVQHSNTRHAGLTCPSSPHSTHGLQSRSSTSRLSYRLTSTSTHSTPTSPNIMNSRRQLECAGYLSPGGLLTSRMASCDDIQGDSESRVQLKGSRAVMQTSQANVYSFGTLLYEMLTLEKPYQNTHGNLIIYKVGQGLIQDLKHLRDGEFKHIIRRCWRSKADSRPSFQELQRTIEQNMSPKSCGLKKSHFSFSVPNQLDKLGTHYEGRQA